MARIGAQVAKAYVRNLSFSIEKQASFTSEGSFPSAVEYLLGALGGDVVNGFESQAANSGLTVEAIEFSLSGRLANPLVVLNVVGAEGSPGFQSIVGTLYVTTDAEESTVNKIWLKTLARSPLVKTLERSVDLSLRMKIAP